MDMKVQILRACSSKEGNRCSFCPAFGHGDRNCIRNAMKDAATALSTLQAENEKLRAEADGMRSNWYKAVEEIKKLRAELERVKRLYESEKEDFIDYACSGVPNLSPYCMNRRSDCVDERGWCRSEKCHGFSRERGQKED